MEVDNPAEWQDFRARLHVKRFKKAVIHSAWHHFVENHAQVAVANDGESYDQSVARTNEDEQAPLPSAMTGMSSASF